MTLRDLIDKSDKLSKDTQPIFNKVSRMTMALPDESRAVRLLRAATTLAALGALVKESYEFWEDHRPSSTKSRTLVVPQNTFSYRVIEEEIYNKSKENGRKSDSPSLRVQDEFDPQSGITIRTSDNDSFHEARSMFGVETFIRFIPGESRPKMVKDSDRKDSSYDESEFRLTFRSHSDREKFLGGVKTAGKMLGNTAPRMIMGRPGGYITTVDSAKPRKIESVFLREGQMERIIKGIESFQNNEDLYADIGIPYHMGILLYGPPGTGKTSTLTAIATHFGMNIAYISLSSLTDDDDLNSIMQELPARSLIIFEDVDTVRASNSREDDSLGEVEDSVTLGGLLNALDGQISPHGCIFGLTTNNFEDLDPALHRDGRIEYREELGYMDNYQFISLYKHLFKSDPTGFPEVDPSHMLTPSMVVGVFRRNIGDLTTASNDLKELVYGSQH